MRNFERPAHYIYQPEAEAGDMIIFTEALVHGTMPWEGEHERRSLQTEQPTPRANPSRVTQERNIATLHRAGADFPIYS